MLFIYNVLAPVDILNYIHRAVTTISSCWVYAISRQGIEQQGFSFGSILHLFPMKVATGHAHSRRCKSPAPGPLVKALYTV